MAPPDTFTSSTSGATGTPAGYGRACTACQRAKCKCVLRASGSDCERCHRLGKPCQPMATSRKRVAKKSTSSRTAQLEEKLEDLVTILRASQPSNGHLHSSNAGDSSPLTNPSNIGHLTSRLESLATAAASSSSSETQPRSYTVPHSYGSTSTVDTHAETSPSSICEDTSAVAEPTPEEAEMNLNRFREWLKAFPCMILPNDMTAATLRKEKPFLWLCIMNMTSMSVEQQMKMKDRVRQEMATRIIINHERSLDCLQGLICYVSWASTTSSPGKPFIITFCQMAVLLAYDLGLTKAPVEEQYFTVCFKMWGGRPPPTRIRTQEERRAVVSLWFLTSVMSSFVGKMDPLQWTPHMSDCLEALERDKLYPSDELLATFVRYQLVADEAQKLLVRDVMGETSPAPTYVFRNSLLGKLQAVRNGSPLHMPVTPILQAHSLATEIQINSIALYRLTTSEDPAWDKDLVRNTADLLVLLDQVVDFLMQMNSAYKIKVNEGEETVFVAGARIIRNIRNAWEPTLSRHLGGASSLSTNQGAVQPISTQQSAQPTMDMTNVNMMDFGDVTWMSDVFGPWEF
ncbi:transcription factor [Fusarium heterosporum]|uniref:Transcription factor n=1 Tax=Fusarium heterosporum TaxID=42747 RepID=A0A8H5TVR9_FUSHE|nr:transcription factor [Fusarium heterosporum]